MSWTGVERARLTVVVGSPGSGQDWRSSPTGWRPGRSEPSAWLSCDVADADPVRFFAGIIESCRRAGR